MYIYRPNNIKIAEEACNRTIKNIFDKDETLSDVKQAMIINEYAPIYKHYKYEAEREWRIIKHQTFPKYRLGEIILSFHI